MSKNETLTGDQLEMVMETSAQEVAAETIVESNAEGAAYAQEAAGADISASGSDPVTSEKTQEDAPLQFRRGNPFRNNSDQDSQEKPVPKILGKIYILAAIPFVVAAVAPYLIGNFDYRQGAALLAWSFTILLVIQSMTVGYRLAENNQRVDLHIVVSLIIAALGLTGVLVVSMGSAETFVGLTLMTVPHRFSSMWLARQKIFRPALMRVHSRFIWTILICHISVMINMIFALKDGVPG